MYFLCNDIIIQPRNKLWLLSNPRTRTHVGVNANFFTIVEKYFDGANEENWLKALNQINGHDYTQEFYGAYGLHNDHTGIEEKNKSAFTGKELFELLVKRFILIDSDLTKYIQFLAPLTSILDRNHLGSFHQRVGQYLTVEKRLTTERWRWWHDQKFAQDGKSVNEGPYKYIQEAFIDFYFTKNSVKGLKILDFGCGNGYYSAKLANFGAQVTGIDLSKELIALAKKNFSKQADFIHFNTSTESLQFLSEHTNEFDIVFMQDVLLLLIRPEDGKPLTDLSKLLSLLNQVLKPNGKLYTMEPNATFWLGGRYGNPHDPYAIITEYENQIFNVVPKLTEVIEIMHLAGFALSKYIHPKWKNNINSKSNYANNFCIWDFMCFVPINK